MDYLTFTAKVIEALAWPLAAVALVALLRHEISVLAPYLKRVKAGPLEAEFERELKALKDSPPTQEAIPNTDQKTPARMQLEELAELHPRSAIHEAWGQVEAAARSAVLRTDSGGSDARYVPAYNVVALLAKNGLAHDGIVNLYHELRKLRNEAAHAPEFSPSVEAAKNYIELSQNLQRYFDSIAGAIQLPEQTTR